MKAITVIESEDGRLVVTGSGIGGGQGDAIDLLHRGIESLASPLRWVIGKEDHAEH